MDNPICNCSPFYNFYLAIFSPCALLCYRCNKPETENEQTQEVEQLNPHVLSVQTTQFGQSLVIQPPQMAPTQMTPPHMAPAQMTPPQMTPPSMQSYNQLPSALQMQ